MSVNVAFNVIRASGPVRRFSTEAPDPCAGEKGLAYVAGTIELSRDESQITYSGISWTRPRTLYRFCIDGVPIQVQFDELSVWQPAPVTLPVLTNIGRKITTAGLTPSRDLSFSQSNLTGGWSINGDEQMGVFSLPAEKVAKPAFGLISVARSGSLTLGAVRELVHQSQPGRAGGFIRYAYEQKLFRGWTADGVPLELRLHLVVDRVQVIGKLERDAASCPSVSCLPAGALLDTQLQPQE